MAFDISTASNAQIAQAIYIAYYQRPAEPGGLDYWTNEAASLKAEGATNLDVAVNFASRFADVQESQDRYPFLSNPDAQGADQFVQNVYQQLFGRQAEQAGEDFYSDRVTEALNNGEPIGQIILDILAGAQNEDSNALENKVAAAESFSNTVQNGGRQYDTEAGQAMLDGVDEDTGDPGQVGTDAANALPPESNGPGETFTLTASGAVITPDDSSDVIPGDTFPGEDNDTFRSSAENLNDSLIDGGLGQNTLNVFNMNQDSTPAQVDNVYSVFLNGRDGDNANQATNGTNTLDASFINGAGQYWSVGSRVDNLQVDNVGNEATVGVRGDHDDVFYTVNFDSSVTSANDSVSVVVDGAGVRAGADDGATVNLNGFTTFDLTSTNIEGSGANTLAELTGDDVTTVNVSGDQGLTVGTLADSIETVDAGGTTETVTTERVTESELTITKDGGTIADGETIEVTVGGNTATITFSGDQDASGIASAIASQITSLANVESASADSAVVTLTAATDADVEVTSFTNNTSATVSSSSSATNTVEETTEEPAGDAFSGDLDVTFGDADEQDGVTFEGGSGNDSADLSAVSISDDADSSVTANGNAGDDDVTVDVGSAGLDGDFAGSVGLDGGEGSNTLNITADDSAGDFADLIALDSVTIENFGEANITVDSATNLGSFDMANLSGTTDFGFQAGTTGGANVNADAENLTENFSLSVDGDATTTTNLGAINVTNVRSEQTSLDVALNGTNSSQINITAGEGGNGGETVSIDIGDETVSADIDNNATAAEAAETLATAIADADLNSVASVSADGTAITITGNDGEDVSLSNYTSTNVTSTQTDDTGLTNAGNLTVDAAGEDDGVTSVNITSNGSGPAAGLSNSANQIGTVNARDGSSSNNQTLQSLSLTAAVNAALTGVDMFAGSADTTDTFSIDLSGAGAADLGNVSTGADVNGIEVTNAGEGDRQMTLDAAGDLKATAGSSQAAGEGVTVSGDGSGTVTVVASDAILNSLTLDGTNAGGDVVAEVTESGAQNVDAANFAGVDQITLSQDITASGAEEVNNIADGTTVRVDADQNNAGLTLEKASGGDLSIVLAEGLGNNEGVTGGLTVQNVAGVEITAEDGHAANAGESVDVTGLSSTVALGDEDVFSSLTLNSNDEDGELVVGGSVGVVRASEISSDQSFTANLNGAGDITVNDLDFATNGGGAGTTLEITDLTVNSSNDGGAYTLTTVDMDSDSDNEVVLNLSGDGDVLIDNYTAVADDDIDIDSSGAGDGTENEIHTVTNQTGNITVTGNQDLSIGDDAAVDIGDTDTFDSSDFTGTLTADFGREAANADENVTVNVGSGDETFNLTADATTGDASQKFAFVFADGQTGDDVIANFNTAANAFDDGDTLDFTAFDSDLSYDTSTNTLSGDNNDFEVNFGDDGDTDSVGDIIDGDGNTVGSIELTGINPADLAAADFAGT